MKLSIWRQFSSNHSASFAVVGEFSSEEQATQAADELRAIIAQIQQWWIDNVRTIDDFAEYRNESELITPIEQKLQKKYGVDWLFSLYVHPSDSKRAVYQYKHLVFVYPTSLFLWKGPQPFDGLLEKLGGQVSVDASESKTHPDSAIYIDFDCQLPEDKLTADILFESFREDFEHLHNLTSEQDYTPNFGFAYYPHATLRIHESEHPIYEVERRDNRLLLKGFILGMLERPGKELPILLEFLENEGCTDIRYTFRSARILGYKDENES